jgi:outer membrane protein OmpA-like peptidoglycan-associated protein
MSDEIRGRYIEHAKWVALLAGGAIAFTVQLVIAQGPPKHALALVIALVLFVLSIAGLFLFVGQMLGTKEVSRGIQDLYMYSMAAFVIAMLIFCVCCYFWVFTATPRKQTCTIEIGAQMESSSQLKHKFTISSLNDEGNADLPCTQLASKWFNEVARTDRDESQSSDAADTRLGVVHFAEGSDELDATALETLEHILVALKKTGPGSLRIAGGTDTVGQDAANYSLGERRARKVAEQVRSRSSVAALNIDSFGERRLEVKTVDNIAEAGNRTVVIELIAN